MKVSKYGDYDNIVVPKDFFDTKIQDGRKYGDIKDFATGPRIQKVRKIFASVWNTLENLKRDPNLMVLQFMNFNVCRSTDIFRININIKPNKSQILNQIKYNLETVYRLKTFKKYMTDQSKKDIIQKTVDQIKGTNMVAELHETEFEGRHLIDLLQIISNCNDEYYIMVGIGLQIYDRNNLVSGHANSLIIDKKHKKIYLIDPHTDGAKYTVPTLELLIGILSNILPEYEYVTLLTEKCELQEDDQMCQSWTLFIIYEFLKNEGKYSINEITQFWGRQDPDFKRKRLIEFLYYIEWMQNSLLKDNEWYQNLRVPKDKWKKIVKSKDYNP